MPTDLSFQQILDNYTLYSTWTLYPTFRIPQSDPKKLNTHWHAAWKGEHPKHLRIYPCLKSSLKIWQLSRIHWQAN